MQSDPTAIAILEHISGVLDYNSAEDRRTGSGLIPQKKARRFDCRYLARLPLSCLTPSKSIA